MFAISLALVAQLAVQSRSTLPVLSYPEPGMDDTAAYQGYRTRFYRDSRGNTVQIYLDPRGGRVVHLWADAVNESVGFTARDAAGRPARLDWGGDEAAVADSGALRWFEYRLAANSPRLDVGLFILGSMRVERDFQYQRGHLRAFGAAPFELRELTDLIATLSRLPAAERTRHLELIHAGSVAELRARLRPTVGATSTDTLRTIRVTQPSFDGRNRLVLEFAIDPRTTTATASPRSIAFRARAGGRVVVRVRIGTDSPALTPLRREEIFSRDFLAFLASGGVPAGTASPVAAATREVDSMRVHRARWLERQVASVELLASQEKLMAGLPNYATYFGRDMMMTALMMQPIWSPVTSEHVIASVLRKLSPDGQVSHEEALGGQAIREGAAEYSAVVREYLRRGRAAPGADSLLARARAILGDLQRVRENYHMKDDEFQLPVLTALYLGAEDIPADRKRAFLLRRVPGGETHLALLLREMAVVARWAEPYARSPVASNLVGFERSDATHWSPASWRDSRVGYANGRFAMDINAIWVPKALESIGGIMAALHSLGFTEADLAGPGIAGAPLAAYARSLETLRRDAATWRGAARHFEVSFAPDEIRSRVAARLRALPADERRHWERVLAATGAADSTIRFAALSLDSAGRPIPVANTDPATRLFLDDVTAEVRRGGASPDSVVRAIEVFRRPYPVGLLIRGLGPVVANDAYATPEVWRAFRDDLYHSPRVVWGREVNLAILGLSRQLASALDTAGQVRDPSLGPYVRSLRETLGGVVDAVEASGLKHNELWSYRVAGDTLLPVRYGSSTDIQLWNVTDLAVQFVLSRMR